MRPPGTLAQHLYSMVSDTEAISVSGLYAAANGKLGVVSEG